MLTINEDLTLLVLGGQLVVFWQQRRLMAQQLRLTVDAEERSRRHDRLSVRPYIDFVLNATPKHFSVFLENHGTGPAINVRVEARIDGNLVSGDTWPTSLLRALNLGIGDFDLEKIQHGVVPMPSAQLRAGGQIRLLDLHFSETVDVGALRRRLMLEARYESIYLSEDEPFVATTPPLASS